MPRLDRNLDACLDPMPEVMGSELLCDSARRVTQLDMREGGRMQKGGHEAALFRVSRNNKQNQHQFVLLAARTKAVSSALKRGASSKKGAWPMPW